MKSLSKVSCVPTLGWKGFCDRYDLETKPSEWQEWENLLAEYMRNRYVASALNSYLHQAASRQEVDLDAEIDALVPTNPKIQKGDLAEALCSLCFATHFGLFAPYLKWANKNSRNVSEPGIDLLAFKFDYQHDGKDEMVISEVKWRKTGKDLKTSIVHGTEGIIAKFNKLNSTQIKFEINLVLKKIENEPGNQEKIPRILAFLDKANPPGMTVVAAFFAIDSGLDADSHLAQLSNVARRPIRIFVYHIQAIETRTQIVFKKVRSP